MTTFDKAIERFEKAVRAHDNRGAQPPEDWRDIEDEYEAAKNNLKMQRKL